MNLQTKILSLVTIVALGIGVLSAVMINRVMLEALNTEMAEKTLIVCRVLAEQISPLAIKSETVMTHHALQDLVKVSDDLIYAFVTDFDNKIFAHTFTDDFPKSLADAENEHETIKADQPLITRYMVAGKPILDMAYPLISGRPAHLHLGMDESRLITHVKTLRNSIIILTSMLVVFAIFFVTAISRRITLPLKQMANLMQSYSKGGFIEKVNIESSVPEVEQLKDSFNKMIEHRRKAEEALQQERERLQEYFDIAGIILIALDREGNIVLINKKGCEVLGYTEEELIGSNCFDISLPPSMKEESKKAYAKMMAGEMAGVDYYEHPIITKSGEEKMTAWRNSLFRDKDDRIIGMLGSGEDITERILAEEERRNLEAQFHQAQKMEAIGTLAGGIAHDFNNILLEIQSYASLILIDHTPEELLEEKIKAIEQQVDNGAELTGQLLGFARGGKYEAKPTDPNRLIDRATNLFSRTKKNILISKNFQKNIWMVEVDRNQIQQVLLNLYVNAWQAMPDGGTLRVETRNVTIDEDDALPKEGVPGKYVKISITDTGKGMDSETLERIFDPFFTTKQKERGTGLGLASAYGIIKNHSGFISVKSKLGEGTTFDVYLPMTGRKPTERETSTDEEIAKGTETILIVEDEESLLRVEIKILEAMGYEVLSAANGRKAIEIFKKKHDQIALVILDMIMPGLSGDETYNRLKKISMDFRVLLATGYSLDEKAEELLNDRRNDVIKKPFSAIELSQKVRKLLD